MFPEKEGELHLFINALFWYYNFEHDFWIFFSFLFLFLFNEHIAMPVHAFLS